MNARGGVQEYAASPTQEIRKINCLYISFSTLAGGVFLFYQQSKSDEITLSKKLKSSSEMSVERDRQ